MNASPLIHDWADCFFSHLSGHSISVAPTATAYMEESSIESIFQRLLMQLSSWNQGGERPCMISQLCKDHQQAFHGPPSTDHSLRTSSLRAIAWF